MVDREVTLTYEELLARELTESWITLNCVSNPVGGSLIGNARWSGVRARRPARRGGRAPGRRRGAADLRRRLDLRDPAGRADRRPQRDARGRDERQAAADRPRVPGPHDRARAVRVRLRLQVGRRPGGHPLRRDQRLLDRARLGGARAGQDVVADRRAGLRVARSPPGDVRIGGVAWAQHTGIEAVEVALDGGDWVPAEISSPPTDDTWVQWAVTVSASEGDHVVRVRATDKTGRVQTGRRARRAPRRVHRLARGRLLRDLTPSGRCLPSGSRRVGAVCPQDPAESALFAPQGARRVAYDGNLRRLGGSAGAICADWAGQRGQSAPTGRVSGGNLRLLGARGGGGRRRGRRRPARRSWGARRSRTGRGRRCAARRRCGSRPGR